ncbi:TPA: sugar transferase [Streptococcus suis]
MYKQFGKRLLDLLISSLFLPFVFLLTLVVSFLIILDDGFPIFFKGKRIGVFGNEFEMYKFRSMRRNAPDIRNADGSTYNSEDDPRITRVGKFLRKTSIDELPQIFNVIKGEMSIVGPRPLVPINEKHVDNSHIFIERLEAKPGITGYSQAYFRNSISQYEKFKYDAYYARNITFIGDLKIIIKTVISVIKRDNIY